MQYKHTEARELALKAILASAGEQFIEWKFIHSVLAAHGLNVTQKQVEKNLRNIEREPWPAPGADIDISSAGVKMGQKEATKVDQRASDHSRIKDRLAIALWDFLLGGKPPANRSAASRVQCTVYSTNLLDEKRRELRRKHVPAIWIDAGSTCAAAMRMLLESYAFPMAVTDSDGKTLRLIRPVFHTNSFDIVKAVEQSSRHRLNVKVRLVGGDLQMDLKSVSGVLADSCLDSWRLNGDVAIVGATGLRKVLGVPAFCCDDPEEAALKTRFLESCWFRVVIADSSKFSRGTVNKSFVPVDLSRLDLVVTDDGAVSGNGKAVQEFRGFAQANGVACLIVGTTRQEGG